VNFIIRPSATGNLIEQEPESDKDIISQASFLGVNGGDKFFKGTQGPFVKGLAGGC
jgi:hypothetical protein